MPFKTSARKHQTPHSHSANTCRALSPMAGAWASARNKTHPTAALRVLIQQSVQLQGVGGTQQVEGQQRAAQGQGQGQGSVEGEGPLRTLYGSAPAPAIRQMSQNKETRSLKGIPMCQPGCLRQSACPRNVYCPALPARVQHNF